MAKTDPRLKDLQDANAALAQQLRYNKDTINHLKEELTRWKKRYCRLIERLTTKGTTVVDGSKQSAFPIERGINRNSVFHGNTGNT